MLSVVGGLRKESVLFIKEGTVPPLSPLYRKSELKIGKSSHTGRKALR